MSEPPPSGAADDVGRLRRCIRDLAALNALPAMCVGKTPDEALDTVVDALPTVLSCDFVYLLVPGTPIEERATVDGAPASEAQLTDVKAALAARASGLDQLSLADIGALWCLDAELRVGREHGRLLIGRRAPIDPETDRVLVRSAANIVGSTLETARVLDVAHRKDEFLAMLGHELRNPLAPIVTAVELLRRHPSAEREQQVIERHARHLTRLADDLMDISRVTCGHVELRNEQVSLASVVERAAEIATPLISRHRHSLSIADTEGLTLRGDPVRLAQVFGNLLTNAAKFTPSQGRIEVTIERLPDRVRVGVKDNGRGIARAELGRIFEPFVQADRERDSLRGGLGLGLAIVARLVEQHAGRIFVHSDGAGRGATFTVELPIIATADEPAVVEAPQPPSVRAGIRVLVVDDNMDLAELLSESLQLHGFQTAVAHDAYSAIERWRSYAPHAAVLDVGLPELDGYELAKTLRAEHGRSPTLIAATGYGQPSDRVRATEAGFDCHFVKPVSVHDLVVALDQRVVAAAARHSATHGH